MQLIYRTNESGSVVKLDCTSSSTGDASAVNPVRIEVFRAIFSGGSDGDTMVINLQADGRIFRSLVTPGGKVNSKFLSRQFSPQEVRQFQLLLNERQFTQFDHLSYPAPAGATNFYTFTLSSQNATVRYADVIYDQLPRELQGVIQAFKQLMGEGT